MEYRKFNVVAVVSVVFGFYWQCISVHARGALNDCHIISKFTGDDEPAVKVLSGFHSNLLAQLV